jgi:CDP-paratose 2-epimerase
VRALVTGGSGYLGTHVRRSFNADDMSRRGGRDVLSISDASAVAEYDLIIHLAAHLDKSDAGIDQCFMTNVEGTVNLLKNVKEGAAFIFASTKDVYGRFADTYAEVPETCPTLYAGQTALEWSKLIAERYVEYYAHSRGFRSCIFRLSTVYAPMSEGNTPNFVGNFVDAINLGNPIGMPGGGKPVRDLMHVDDLSAACAAFAESIIRHGLYNLGGGRTQAVSLSELVERMEMVSGLQAVIDDQTLPAPIPINYVSDLSRIDQELGWKPGIGIDEGLATLFGR